MTTTVAVTGITGFLGRAIARALGERGLAVRGVVRRAVAVPEANELRVAALEPGAALATALARADVVVHCAGGGRAVTADDFRRNNLDTTEAILAAIEGAAARPRQFVLVSSVAAGGPDGNGADALSSAACTARSSYGRHKWLAERACLELARRLGGEVQVTIVRAPAIYGPGDDRFAPLVRAARKGWLMAPSPDAPLSMIDVDDCAAGIVATIEHPASGPRLYWLEDGERYSARRMSAALARHFGKRLHVARIPLAALTAAALAAEAHARVTGRAAFLTRDKLLDLTAPAWICDSKALRAETGFRTRHTFEARVPAIVASLGLGEARS
ncbi:MAG: NAD-dependent epimerase/dehydratase family protein [Deltaproteobacteria bacterium]|nr:NAD-dependent epimerase/dehydratase family protein [Deltaproteobacteria bacterium]